MGAVTTSLAERATSRFDELGYTVSGTGSGLRAERKWRVVDISLGRPESIPASGDFHCFVTPAGEAAELYRELASRDPEYEWAVMRIDDREAEFLRPGATSSDGDDRGEGSDPIVT